MEVMAEQPEPFIVCYFNCPGDTLCMDCGSLTMGDHPQPLGTLYVADRCKICGDPVLPKAKRYYLAGDFPRQLQRCIDCKARLKEGDVVTCVRCDHLHGWGS